MKFSSEAALQAFLHAYLGGQREVTLSPACRIDLRTDKYDIEIKLVLSNSAMDKAAGQLRRYSTYSEGRKQVIAGCAPKNFNASNRRMAQSFRDAGVEVWFVDREPEFQEAYQALYYPESKPTPLEPTPPKSSPPKPVPSVHSQRTKTPDSILKLSPLLARLAKEGHSEAIAKMMSSEDPEGELTTVQSAIKWKLYVDGKKLSSGEFVRRTETAAESEFINSPVIEKVIKKRRQEAEGADPRKSLAFLTPLEPTPPKSSPPKPVPSVHSQRTKTPDSILKLSPLLARLAKEGHSEAIAKMMSSEDPEGELTTVQSAIKWKLYVDGKKLSSGEFVRRTETAAESEFINSPVIEKVIKKRRQEAEEADPGRSLALLIAFVATFLFIAFVGLGLFSQKTKQEDMPVPEASQHLE